MKKPAMSFALLLITTVNFAAEPPAPAPNAAPATGAAALAASAAPTTQPPNVATTDPTAASAALAQAAHDLGYSKKLLGGKIIYYCKGDAEIGTRMTHTKCYTEDQMSALVQRSIANRQSVADFEHKWMNQPGGDHPPPVNGGMTGMAAH